MQILRNFFNPTSLPTPPGRNVPGWLGDFKFHIYGKGWSKDPPQPLPHVLHALHDSIAAELPPQEWTTWFLQRYETNTSVRKHRDPRNNLHYTYIAVFGDFEGAQTTVWSPEPTTYQLLAGDVGILPCTIDGIQGNYHAVSPITRGTRFAFIGNTIR